MNKNITGENIKRIRIAHGLTQEQLTARLHVLGINLGRSSVAKIESGTRPVFDYQVEGFANALNVDIKVLFKK
ncbi:helix-turn-helix domain-containing protein [Anaerosolibacter sp.]|uniref:helix-turn-helix domain-containing protein n=1 Tax=Anaerosolibacter sp. TaxID=1872527 RepID=UPI0039EFB15C